MAATILIADDDAVQRRLVEAMVQKCGYEAVVVESGDAALAVLTGPEAPVIDAVVLEDAARIGTQMPGQLGEAAEVGRAHLPFARHRVQRACQTVKSRIAHVPLLLSGGCVAAGLCTGCRR